MSNDDHTLTRPDDDAVMSAVRSIILSGERLRQYLAVARGVGLSEIVALGHLHHDGVLTPRELSVRLGLSSGTMTALVDRLEAAELASRSPNPDDRRSQLIHISDAGSEIMAAVYHDFNASAAGTLADLDAAARRQLIDVMATMSAEIDTYAATFEQREADEAEEAATAEIAAGSQG